MANIALSDTHAQLLQELSVYYLQSRYPEEIEKLGQGANRFLAERIHQETTEVLAFLKLMLK